MNHDVLDELLRTLDVSVEALALCNVSQGTKLIGPPEKAITIHYVLSGTLHLAMADWPPIVCKQGGIVIVPPGLGQIIGADPAAGQPTAAVDRLSQGRDGLMIIDAATSVPGDLKFACSTVSSNVPGLVNLLENGGRPLTEDLSDLPFVDQAFELMLAELSALHTGVRALTSALMKACLILMARRRIDHMRHDDFALMPACHPKLGRAVNAVLSRPSLPHTVASMASHAGMSRSSFAREFADAFGLTPMAFVARARLHRAADMLQATTAPIKSVAAASGFPSRSHFSRTFREIYGADPSKFRAQRRADSSAAVPSAHL